MDNSLLITTFYKRDGTPYPKGPKGAVQWNKDFGNMKYRRVAKDVLSNKVEISTIWLGVHHNFCSNTRPLIFETMLFVPQHKEINIYGRKFVHKREQIGETWRYSTEEEALRGHKMLVKKWSKFKSAEEVLNRP